MEESRSPAHRGHQENAIAMNRLSLAALTLLFLSCVHTTARRDGYVPVEGGQLFYVVEGRGQPVILLHGGFMDHRMWDRQAAAFARQHQVIRYDMRGHGRSPASTAPYDPAEDVAAILAHLGIERAHVVGLSMGGSFAIDFAILHPQRVRSLVLAEPGLGGHRWSDDVTGTMRAVRTALRERGREAAIATFLETRVFASARDKVDAWRTIREQLQANFSLDPKPMKPMEPPAIERLAEIGAPTLVIVSSLGGPDSRVIRDAILQSVPNARQELIADCGHMMNLEQPERFNALVLRFLEGK